MSSTRIVREINVDRFKSILSEYRFKIRVSSHALDHLSGYQRSIFTEKDLLKVFLSEIPRAVGLQKNNCYSSFYQRKHGYLRIVFKVERWVEIITFINMEKLPNIGRLEG